MSKEVPKRKEEVLETTNKIIECGINWGESAEGVGESGQ